MFSWNSSHALEGIGTRVDGAVFIILEFLGKVVEESQVSEEVVCRFPGFARGQPLLLQRLDLLLSHGTQCVRAKFLNELPPTNPLHANGSVNERKNWPLTYIDKLPVCNGLSMVPEKGLEPPRACAHMVLNHACLPISPLRHAKMIGQEVDRIGGRCIESIAAHFAEDERPAIAYCHSGKSPNHKNRQRIPAMRAARSCLTTASLVQLGPDPAWF